MFSMKKYERLAWWGILAVAILVGQLRADHTCSDSTPWFLWLVPFAIFIVAWAFILRRMKRN